MSNVKVFFRSPTSFFFVDNKTLLSDGLVSLPVGRFPWQVSLDSGISNILGSPHGWRCQVLLLAGAGTWSPCSITSSLCFLWFTSLPKLGCSGLCSVDQAGLKLRKLPASASGVLGLKVCTATPGSKLFFNSFSYK